MPGKISSHAANAAPFTPRGLSGTYIAGIDNSVLITEGTATPTQLEPETNTFSIADIKEFTPRTFDTSQGVSHAYCTADRTLTISQLSTNGGAADQVSYDPFSMQNLNQAMPSGAYNPYLEDSNIPTNAANYFQAQTAFSSPAQPVGSTFLVRYFTDFPAPIPPLCTNWPAQGRSSRVSKTRSRLLHSQ